MTPRPGEVARTARALLAAGRAEEAIAPLRAALFATPHHADLAALLGDALLASGQAAPAQATWQSLLDRDASVAARLKLHGKLALAAEAVGAPVQALAAWDAHLSLLPDDLRAIDRRAQLLHAMPARQEAAIDAWQAFAQHPAASKLQRLRAARMLIARGRGDLALDIADALIAADPQAIEPIELAIRAAQRIDRRADVIRLRDSALATLHDPLALARVILLAGDPADARALLADVPGDAARSLRHAAALADGDYRAARDLVAREGADARIAQLDAALRAVPAAGARFPEALFAAVLALPSNRARAASDTIVLATANLGGGGAERQVALSAAGVARRRPDARTILSVGSLDPGRGHDAMLALARAEPALIVAALPDDPVDRMFVTLAEHGVAADRIDWVRAFPDEVARDIARLMIAFVRERPAVVHLWQDNWIGAGAVAAVLAGVPRIVASARNMVPATDDRRRWRRWLPAMYRALAGRDDVVLTANTRIGADDYATLAGIPRDAVTVVPNGVDVSALAARAALRPAALPSPGGPVIGGVFRLVPAKRPLLWIETAARIAQARADARFVIVGEGPMRAELRDRAAALGIADRLVLPGFRGDIEAWIAAMDVMLLTSSAEGLPNVLIEAQALGVPVVSTAAGGAAEAIVDPTMGTIAGADPVALASAVVACLSHPPAPAIGPRAVERRFGIAQMIDRTIALYAR